uniref:Ig-like domain-containing protein n=1 Tax=Myripristis murdjan TaxID=586833 RepID=A0A667Z9Z1_9TELE
MESEAGKMIIYFPAVFLLCHLCAAQYSEISQPVSFQTVELGHPVSIECQIKSALRTRVWYKLTAGRKLQDMVSVDIFYNRTIFGSQFQQLSHRFSVTNDGIKTDLSISAATWEDIGTYYCGVQHINFIEFGPGTFLMLKGISFALFSMKSSYSHLKIQPGDSVTLSCSVHSADCGGEHTSVFWLKSSESSGPEVIYNSGNKSESCKRTESGSLETSCVYKLPKQNLSSDDAGTYYCVVASCGETLFGNGTQLYIKGKTLKLKINTAVSLGILYTNITIFTLSSGKTDRSSEGNQVTQFFIIIINLLLPTIDFYPKLFYFHLCPSQPGDEVNYPAVSLAPRSSSSRTAAVQHSTDPLFVSEVRYRLRH